MDTWGFHPYKLRLEESFWTPKSFISKLYGVTIWKSVLNWKFFLRSWRCWVVHIEIEIESDVAAAFLHFSQYFLFSCWRKDGKQWWVMINYVWQIQNLCLLIAFDESWLHRNWQGPLLFLWISHLKAWDPYHAHVNSLENSRNQSSSLIWNERLNVNTARKTSVTNV